MKNLNSVFLGVSKSTQKRLYVSLLKELKDQYPILNIPCVGAFTLIDAAMEAGYQPSQIRTSDISLFSSVLGYLFTGRSLSELKFSLGDPWREEYDALKTDRRKAAYLIWLMKGLQIRQEIFYEAIVYEYLTKTKEEIIDEIEKKLELKIEKYKGLKYEIADLRKVLDTPCPGSVNLVHAPAYASGYTKQFDFEPHISWHETFEEYSFSKEFQNSYDDSSCKENEVWIWSAYDTTRQVPKKDVLFAEEVGKNKFEYFCVTRPDIFVNHPLAYQIQYKKKKDVKSLGIGILPRGYEITESTKIGVHSIQGEHALYYRDLWAHKMGTTKAECYFLFTLDGMAFGVTGIHLSDVLRLKSTDIMEVFGFDQPLENHPNSHKLFMMLLTCWDFKKVLEKRITKNRIHEIKGFKTTCLTKYRKLKSSTGLLTIVNREKLPNGMYKLMYQTPFYKRSFQQTLEVWKKDFDIQDLRKNLEGDGEDAREFDESGEEA